MDTTDLLLGNKDCLYDEDFLDHLTNDYQWSSLLHTTDASPSEILADAAPILVPPISPILSVKSSQTESSNSDSGSEDDSKNSSFGTSERQSSQSPFDWMSSFDDEPPSNLKPEDVELFLQKTVPIPSPISLDLQSPRVSPERNGPVMAIENGVIKGTIDVNTKCGQQVKTILSSPPSKEGKAYIQNAYFKVVNENFSMNTNKEDNKVILSDQIKLVVEQKKIPSILKRPVLVHNKPPNIVIPSESTKGGKIAISPLPQIEVNAFRDSNGSQIKMSPPRSGIVISSNPVVSNLPVQNGTTVVQNGAALDTESPDSPTLDLSHLTAAEIRAVKKQQRMIKNRESACQSRQKKKDYVTALEHQLSQAHQQIARLELENKMLRNQLETSTRGRKIARLDTSLLIPKKNIAVIFAMVFMVSLNFNVLGWNRKPFVGPPSTPHRSTRHLLWSEDNAEVNAPDYEQAVNRSRYGTDCRNTTTKDYVNQTESIRIVGELNRWIGGGKTLNWTYDVPRKKPNVYLSEDKINGGLLDTYGLFHKLNVDSNLVDFPSTNRRNVKEKARLRRLRRNKDLDFSESAVYDYKALIPKPLRKGVDDFDLTDLGEWNALLEALQRRDDTFYVVGVGKGEHLLLPAVSHNVTIPPKMALILPAISGNDSLMNGHVTLMQIDCSIVNTSLVKLKPEALPASVRSKPMDDVRHADQPHRRESKLNTYFRPNPANIDDNLADRNSSNNISNFPADFKTKSAPIKDMNMPKDDVFAQYLISKYEKSKSNSDNVTSIRKGNKKSKELKSRSKVSP